MEGSLSRDYGEKNHHFPKMLQLLCVLDRPSMVCFVHDMILHRCPPILPRDDGDGAGKVYMCLIVYPPMESLESMIKRLPPDLQQEAIDFVQFLLEKHVNRKRTHLKLDWVGGLSEYRDQHTSLGLQKKALEWWEDEDVSH